MIKKSAINPRHSKLRGELAELRFMVRAADYGLRIIKPWGDSARYDFVVETGGRFLRIQVKSTSVKQDECYCCHLNTGKQKPYTKDEIDFIAAYIVPKDIWYIMPFEVAGKACSGLILSPHLKNAKHARFKEAWHLLCE
jgi:hypothetical protein